MPTVATPPPDPDPHALGRVAYNGFIHWLEEYHPDMHPGFLEELPFDWLSVYVQSAWLAGAEEVEKWLKEQGKERD